MTWPTNVARTYQNLTKDEVQAVATASSLEAMRDDAVSAGDPLAGFWLEQGGSASRC